MLFGKYINFFSKIWVFLAIFSFALAIVFPNLAFAEGTITVSSSRIEVGGQVSITGADFPVDSDGTITILKNGNNENQVDVVTGSSGGIEYDVSIRALDNTYVGNWSAYAQIGGVRSNTVSWTVSAPSTGGGDGGGGSGSSGAGVIQSRCSSDTNCSAGLVCDIREGTSYGRCQLEDGNTCVKDEDCRFNSACKSGVCEAENTIYNPTTPNTQPGGSNSPPGGAQTGRSGSSGGNCNGDPNLVYENGLCLPPKNCNPNSFTCASSITDLIVKVVKFLLTIAGAIAVLFLILGGYWYMTSGGNEETAEKGKKTLINAIIGLVVVIMSYAIINTVVSTLA